jgi:hypothetical protein
VEREDRQAHGMPEKHVLSRPAVLELLTIDYSNPARLGGPELDRRHDS